MLIRLCFKSKMVRIIIFRGIELRVSSIDVDLCFDIQLDAAEIRVLHLLSFDYVHLQLLM